MTVQFRIVDLRSSTDNPVEFSVDRAKSPEEAARLATGEILVRSGHPRDLRVRVYFQQEGQPVTMVRLYRRVEDRP
jgi:hypothetical protein